MFRRLLVAVLLCCSNALIATRFDNSADGRSRATISMGKMAKFGIFSPAVYAGRVVLGDKQLEKFRGKAISLHSQAITEFCSFVGTSNKMRGMLIKKAKVNGDTLGFLV